MSERTGIETRNTRTGSSRKIDEWRVKLPGGDKATFDVTMVYEDGTCVFQAKTDHDRLSDIQVRDTDINALKGELDRRVRHRIETGLSEGWVAASVVEVRHKMRVDPDAHHDIRFDLSVNLSRVEARPDRKPGNFPLIETRTQHRTEDLLIRSHAEDFASLRPKSGKLTDPEVREWLSSPASRDDESGLGRVVTHGPGDDETRLIEALNRFSERLSERLAPGVVDISGIPDPDELVELMRLAAPDPEPPKEEGPGYG